MEKKITYKKEDLNIVWQPHICIHSKKCWKELSQVFKPREKPWVQPEHATLEEIKKQIDLCPSGALSYESNEKKENNMSKIEAKIAVNGPILITGTIEIQHTNGTVETKEKVSLCRCGASANKPFCDGAHKRIDFQG